MTIEELIAKLAAASDGSAELDDDVARYFAHNHYEWWRDRAGRADFTRSIDAALTLVPGGWTVARIGQDDLKNGTPRFGVAI